MPPRVLVNSQPLKKCVVQGAIATTSSIDNFLKTSDNAIFGVVIWIRENTIGEVLVQENFEDINVHFVFNSSTQIRYGENSSQLGIGSLVQIGWEKKLTSRTDENHVIVYIEKMSVFECLTMIKSEIFIVHNSQSMAGVSIGMTEQDVEVVFHPSCSAEIRCETYQATRENLTEFRNRTKFHSCERVKQMVNAWMIVAPFTIDLSGSFANIRFFVVEKISSGNDHEESAVITNIVRKMFMEAKYLSTPESIFFNTKACHSNILNQFSVGSIVRVKSSKTFESSRYHRYGYDVTIEKYRKNSICKKKNHNSIIEENYKKNDINILEHSKNTLEDKDDIVDIKEQKSDAKIVEIKNNDSYVPLNTAGKNFKIRYHLLDGCKQNLNSYEVPFILESYRDPYLNIDFDEFSVKKPKMIFEDIEMKNRIRKALEIHNLLKDDSIIENVQVKKKKIPQIINEKMEYFREEKRIPKTRKEFKLEKIVEVLGTIHKSKILEEKFVLPDTNWKPRERRVVGLFDNLQWVLMGTFVLSKEEVEEMQDVENESPRQLAGGWWYRRTVPREYPIQHVETLKTSRNILEDCTKNLDF
ncbi:unnamed protein product [Caenorhabditis angaria]|uniref:Uncharacterized protein n=1 Tax=Caenorhabditis angaria TaxID=860376 RepID=A0A9P1ICB5_9PELO|nr:unnamed protein product [Caenorhabditis angaria]